MLLVAVAWIYVVLMAAVVEASSPQGTIAGAAATLLFCGVLPLGILAYLFFSPARRRRRKAREALASAPGAVDPDQPGESPGGAVAPIREEP